MWSKQGIRALISGTRRIGKDMKTVRIDVYVQPRASKSELAGMHDGAIKIRVRAPAVENAGNRALIDFIARCLGIPKRCVRVVSGVTNRIYWEQSERILRISNGSAAFRQSRDAW
jgi:uncharacterized protein